MKVIFLDIDGVLNNAHTKEKFCGFTGIDGKLRDMFLSWLADRNYSIVLSSSWRIPSAYGDFKQHLNDNGITWVGETPYLKGIGRGYEIRGWFEENQEYVRCKYAILDDYDSSKFLKYQRPYLVQTSAIKGLEPKKLKKLDELLS